MSTLGIFILGAFITAMVGGALALVIIGAVQDGRLARQARAQARGARYSPPPPVQEQEGRDRG